MAPGRQAIVNAFNQHPDQAFRVRELHELLGMPTDGPAMKVTRSRLGRLTRQGFVTRLTAARLRRGFRNIRAHLACPARVPKPRGAGPGQPPGAKNKHRAPRYDAGRTVKRPETLKVIGKPGRLGR